MVLLSRPLDNPAKTLETKAESCHSKKPQFWLVSQFCRKMAVLVPIKKIITALVNIISKQWEYTWHIDCRSCTASSSSRNVSHLSSCHSDRGECWWIAAVPHTNQLHTPNTPTHTHMHINTVFTGRMPFQSSNQQCQRTEWMLTSIPKI